MGIEAFKNRIFTDPNRIILLFGDSIFVGVGYLERAIVIASELDLVILGIEGFDSDGLSITPRMDFIADFGSLAGRWQERVASSRAAALDNLAPWRRGPQFAELILIGKEEAQ